MGGPREKLVACGPAALSAAELIGLVWGLRRGGGRPPPDAGELLLRMDGLDGLSRAHPRELEGQPGVGPSRAASLAAAFELGRRALTDWPTGRWVIRSPTDLADRLVLQMGRLEREELRVVLLNTRNAVLAAPTIYQGNVSTALVRIGELFRDAVRQHAAGIVLVHNHPSGDPTPSPDDLHLTAESVAAGRLLDVAVLDHLIVGHDSYVSLRDRGIPFARSRAA
ncbi:DNA repair protein RadC [soil metagenome]